MIIASGNPVMLGIRWVPLGRRCYGSSTSWVATLERFKKCRAPQSERLRAERQFYPGTTRRVRQYTTKTQNDLTSTLEGQEPIFNLHTYFRSSCSARLRIACNLKGIPLSYTYVNLLKKEQRDPSYLSTNPSGQVPTLTPITGDLSHHQENLWPITQSVAALEYLEEVFPECETKLLPPLGQAVDRVNVRTLANVIACDVQPVTSLRVLRRVKKVVATARSDGDAASNEWAKDFSTQGFRAYEDIAAKTAGQFSVGDSISFADVCLIPAVWAAIRFKVDLEQFPVLKGVYERMSELGAVKKAHWKNQEDTPEDLR